jgi:hypothetical protein
VGQGSTGSRQHEEGDEFEGVFEEVLWTVPGSAGKQGGTLLKTGWVEKTAGNGHRQQRHASDLGNWDLGR